MYRQVQNFVRDHESIAVYGSVVIGFTAMVLLHSYGPTQESSYFVKSVVSVGVSALCLKVADKIKEQNPNHPMRSVVASVGVGSLFHAMMSAGHSLLDQAAQDHTSSNVSKPAI